MNKVALADIVGNAAYEKVRETVAPAHYRA